MSLEIVGKSDRVLKPKFKRNEKVIVVNGFERGRTGVVKEVRYETILGVENEYEVYFGLFSYPSEVYIKESYLESL